VWQNYDFYARVPIEQSFDKNIFIPWLLQGHPKNNVGKFNSSQWGS
jgi:hypothetical protein